MSSDTSTVILSFGADNSFTFVVNGVFRKNKWQYNAYNDTISVFLTENEGYMLQARSVMDNVLALTKYGTDECIFIHDNEISLPPSIKSGYDVSRYLNRKKTQFEENEKRERERQQRIAEEERQKELAERKRAQEKEYYLEEFLRPCCHTVIEHNRAELRRVKILQGLIYVGSAIFSISCALGFFFVVGPGIDYVTQLLGLISLFLPPLFILFGFFIWKPVILHKKLDTFTEKMLVAVKDSFWLNTQYKDPNNYFSDDEIKRLILDKINNRFPNIYY